jgi:hypothetical protein
MHKKLGQSSLLHSLPLACVTGDGTPLALPSEDKTFDFDRDGLESEIKVCNSMMQWSDRIIMLPDAK